MNTIENQFKQLRLQGMYITWKALMETRQHHELSLRKTLRYSFRRKHKTAPTGVLKD